MRALRLAGDVVLWLVAALGLASLATWGATQAGWIQPLVVVSGSMEPEIMTGDLLIAVPQEPADLRAGDVAALRSAVTGDLVTHRVVSVEESGEGQWAVHMKGDANASPDAETYVVDQDLWQPAARVPGGGYVVAKLTSPQVAIPLGVALVALMGLSLLPASSRPSTGADAEDAHPAPAEPARAEVAP
ncbi:signal peptidase I [Actinotalea sp. JY-7885]|uniref:signal peptidase I n=1 Tax=Actinotalea sp. JY-7885 TaxID=2758576 RepID=UPI00165DD323|nr:signal peptidase I [Actinotalea sp. JY-7885]